MLVVVELAEAMEVFAHGFSFARSRTHPYLIVREGSFLVLRDAPRTSGDYRREEIVVLGGEPDEVVAAIRAVPRRRYVLSIVHGLDTPVAEIRAAYKAYGYRAIGQEPFFIRDLSRPPAPDPRVRRLASVDEERRMRRERRGRQQIRDEHIGPDDAPIRAYVAWDGDDAIGWVKSIRTGDRAWVADLWVRPDRRRAGLGGALMRTMLADDARLGVRTSVLLASTAGAHLYPLLGYEQIGTLQLFMPKAEP